MRTRLAAMLALTLAAATARAQPFEIVASYPYLPYRDGILVTVQLFGTGAMVVSPDGRHVYASGSDAGGFFLRTFMAEDGGASLSAVDEQRQNTPLTPDQETLWGIGPLIVSGDGRRLYAGATHRLLVFDRDETTGTPTLAERRSEAVGLNVHGVPSWVDSIALSPDGHHLYIVGPENLVVLRADVTPVVELTRLAIGSGDWQLAALVVSPDGRHVYAIRRSGLNRGGEILAFARDGETGQLTEIGATRPGEDGHLTLGDPYRLAITPDGRHLHAAAIGNHVAVVTFERNVETGRLTVLEVALQSGPLQGLGGERRPSFTPDGALLLEPPRFGVRDVASGRLRGVGELVPLVNGGDVPTVAAAAPDGEHVYIAPPLTVLRRPCGDGVPSPGEECDDGNRAAGDGCSPTCTVESCFACTGTPSTCAPADDTPCDDGNPCTASDLCSAGTCAGTPSADGATCDDGTACTTGDACLGGRCTGTTVTCGACEACDHAAGCVGAIAVRCAEWALGGPGGRLALTRSSAAGRSLAWSWRGDAATTVAALGDPTTAERLELCVFDSSGEPEWLGGRRRIALAATIPGGCSAGACWRRRNDGRFVFKGSGARSDGIRRIMLRPAADHEVAVTVEGQGRRIPAPALPLVLDPLAEVQLRSSDGACFESRFAVKPTVNTRQAFVSPTWRPTPGR